MPTGKVLLIGLAALSVLLAVACGGGQTDGSTVGNDNRPASAAATADSQPPAGVQPSAAAGTAVPEQAVVGRGSAGPDSREVGAPNRNDVVDTGGLHTFVFVDADG